MKIWENLSGGGGPESERAYPLKIERGASGGVALVSRGKEGGAQVAKRFGVGHTRMNGMNLGLCSWFSRA